jgi:hypothetical protein
MESNQTKFSYEKPFFEEIAPLPTEDSPSPEPMQQKGIIGWIRTHTVLAAVGVTLLVLLLVLLVLAALFSPRNTMVPTDTNEVVTDTPKQLSPLEQKVQNLKSELNQADPTRGQEPFPPVDLDIRLDKSERL